MDLVVARADGSVLPARRLLHRSVAVRSTGRSSPMLTATMHGPAAATTWRPNPRRAVLRARLGDIDLQLLPYGEIDRASRRAAEPASCRPRAGVRPGQARRPAARSGSSPATTSSSTTAPATPFEPVRCDTFVTESTFGLPIYRWAPQAQIFADINDWWRANAAGRQASVMFCYAFGKAQRILRGLDPSIGPILLHGAVAPLNDAYRRPAWLLPETPRLTEVADAGLIRRAMVLAPPSAQGTPWMRRLGDHADAFASGWMQLRGNRRRRGVDRGFVLSDHADWPGLHSAIRATGAQRVIVTHGSVSTMVRWLQEQGLQAQRLRHPVRRRGPGAGMKAFSALYLRLDETTSSNAKLAAMVDYFRSAPAADAAWAVYFLAGGKPRQLVPAKVLREFAQQASGVPQWLFEECYQSVGDLAETIALLVPPATEANRSPTLPDWLAGWRSACCRCGAWLPRRRSSGCATTGQELDGQRAASSAAS